jgi:hypothetical protein
VKNRLRTIAVPTLVVACALATAAVAGAADRTTHSFLRVESIGSTLDPGTNYSNKTIRTRNSGACGPIDSRGERLAGANAMGIVGHAANVNGRLAPFRTSDTFDFGRIVCRVGDFKGFADRAWLYKVNHRSPTVAADLRRVGRADEVLWFFANFSTGRNTGRELELRGAPVRAITGQTFDVRVVGYDQEGVATPVAGARVNGGGTAPPTNAQGRTTVMARATPGTMRLEAVHGDDVASAPVEVCVAANLSRCPDARGETFIGTADADAIRATGGPDSIRPRGGADAVTADAGADDIAVRGGGRDRVDCGPSRDRVVADPDDRIAANCEAVSRRG